MSFYEKENAKAIEMISTIIRVKKQKTKTKNHVALHSWVGPSLLMKRRAIQQLMQEEPNAFLIIERSENNLQHFREDPSTGQTQESLTCSTPLATRARTASAGEERAPRAGCECYCLGFIFLFNFVMLGTGPRASQLPGRALNPRAISSASQMFNSSI